MTDKDNTPTPRLPQRKNLLHEMEQEIWRIVYDDSVSQPIAFRTAALTWLDLENDYDDSEYKTTDGAGDRGIDHYILGDSFAQIYQFKGREESLSSSLDKKVDWKMINDLPRIISGIEKIDTYDHECNPDVSKFYRDIQRKLRLYYKNFNSEENNSFSIEINLILAGKKLSDPAWIEFNKTQKQIVWRKYKIKTKYNMIFIDDLLDKYWAFTNNKWENKKGNKFDSLALNIMQHGESENNIIQKKDTKIAFVKADDLIKAYREIGYRIFEQNVRCKINKSSVNNEIKKQLETEKGIREFHLLNNGITILSDNVSVKKNNSVLNLLRPGIVNGLQTITSLTEAYEQSSDDLKKIFEDNCYVLARIFSSENKSSVFINKLILATNTQNTMDPRNLKSNDPKQIDLERNFARTEPRWFYQRKEFAWQAFKEHYKKWPTLKGISKREFEVKKLKGPPKVRLADNIKIASSWLAFIGYSEQAKHMRKQFFSTNYYYDAIFSKMPNSHGVDLNFQNLSKKIISDHFSNDEPPSNGLLFAFLLGEFTENIRMTIPKIKEKVAQEIEKPITNIGNNVFEYETYIIEYLKSAGHYLYVQMMGYLLFKRYGDKLRGKFDVLLQKTDMVDIYKNYDFNQIKKTLEHEEFEKSNSIAISWAVFHHIIASLVSKDHRWRENFTKTPNSNYIYSQTTQKSFFKELNTIIESFERKRIIFADSWAYFMNSNKNFYLGIFPDDL